MPLNAPSLSAVQTLLAHHLDEHRRLPESARARDLGSERALIQDYSGRVVYELLQNALDRSRERILVRWDPASRCLEVANDGKPVSAYPGQTPRRSDFHALVSLHSSTKRAKESIGNKGVGFRSVFAAAPQVEVWSRTDEGRWWGLRMRHPSQLQPAPDVAWMESEVASFYAPEPITDGVGTRFSAYQTVVRLLDVRPERAHVLEQTVRDLMRVPMRFLEHRAPHPHELRILLMLGDAEVAHRIVDGAQEMAVSSTVTLAVSDEVRRDTGLDLDTAEVRVMACTVPVSHGPATETDPRHTGLYWSYLPTEQDAGFGVDIHADFYLSNSRRSLALRTLERGEEDSASDPAGWNRRLVRQAASLIVGELWQRTEMVTREDFWAYAHPARCRCEHLAFEVGRLLLGDLGVFQDIIRRSFPEDAGPWTLQRYDDFFSALERWATYAYQQPLCAGKQPRYKWLESLLEIVERSQAPVLPIVEQSDDSAMGQRVAVARSLIRGKQGQKRADADRIYLRRSRADAEATESLPTVVQDQGTFVTVFAPPGMQQQDATRYGLMDFSRPELLAQLKPGRDEREHRELLKAALRLASHESVQGGQESVLQRAQTTPGGPAWRLALEGGTTLRRAAQNLRSLYLPTLSGWQPAHRVVRSGGGPWPSLDETMLAGVLAELAGEGPDEPCPHLDTDRVCRLFGIGVLPVDRTGAIPDWPEAPAAALGRSILRAWSRDMAPIFGAGIGERARTQLRRAAWIHGDLAQDAFASLEPGVGPGAPYAPLDLWWQLPQSGFRTRLLPRLIVPRETALPQWARDLGIENPREAQGEDRILRAMERLRGDPAAKDDERDLSDLYRRLVEGILRLDSPPFIPLLHRHVDENGVTRSLEWGHTDDGIWHDPGGAQSSALSAFRAVRVWVYRGASRRNAEALGLIHFDPKEPTVGREGGSNPFLAERLREAIWEALPDLIAAASMAREEFDEQAAIRKQAALQVQHYERVWVRWHFADKIAERGRDDIGDVFLLPLPGGDKAICFDGHDLPLVECAFPLSEWLCDSRAFGPVFRDGLYAWSRAGSDRQRASSVARFRRDHNLSDADITQWRSRLQEARLDDQRKAVWQTRILRVLSRFGAVKDVVRPGIVVTPSVWETTDVASDPMFPDVSEEDLRQALRTALGDDPQFRLLVPLVDFQTEHRERFRRALRLPYIAAVADRDGRGQWNERLLEELQAKGDGVTSEDEAGFSRLRFDIDQALRARYGLPPLDELAPTPEAWSFARGQIPISALPKTAAVSTLRPFAGGSTGGMPRTALSEEAWLRKARRKASGGRRAEDAVLGLAVRQALEWRQRDAQGFNHALNTALPQLGEAGKKRYAALQDEAGLRAFLHVSDYLGDVGFDVLVPDEAAGCALWVEVKRVGSLNEDAMFFLSENERRRAVEYLEKGLPWRLWLVSSTGQVADVSSIAERFRECSQDVQALLNAGLRPGEWMLVLQGSGDRIHGAG